MRREDDLTSRLAALEGPVSPDPAFAARLRDRFLAASSNPSQPQPTAAPIRTLPAATRPPRKRLLDLAAVAVLLLSMVGSLARVSTGGDPTPTIQAPTGSQDGEMVGRSAAGDGQLRGPAPDAAEYERLWTAGEKTFGTPTRGAQTYGRYVFRIPGIGDERHLGDLIALDLHTGQELWRQQVDVSVTAEVTSQGVIAGLPTGEDTFHLALLDLQTGAPIWTWWGETFASLDPPNLASLVVADDAVFFSVSDGSIHALDLASGEIRFGRTAPRIPPLGVSNPLCARPDDCVLRSNTDISMVYGNGTLYVSDLGASTILALSGQNGEELWSVSTIDRVGSTNVSYASMIAVDEGLIVAFQDTTASDITPVVYWGLWSAADGSEVWEGSLALGDQRMVSNGESLFTLFKDPGQGDGLCCDIAEVEVSSGTVTWTRGSVEALSLEGYLSDEDTLIARSIESGEGIYGIDLRAHEVTWSLPLNVNECYVPIFPISPDGTMACLANTGTLAAYRPVGPPQATPDLRQTADQPAVMLGGTAARDNRYPGPAPRSGRYELRLDTNPAERAILHGPGYVYDGRGFVFTFSMSRPFETTLDVFDLETGTEVWTRDLVFEGTVAITPDGVVATVPVDDTSTPEIGLPGELPSPQPYRVTLLELESGEVIWKSAAGYGGTGETAYPTVMVDGQRIFLSDNLGTLVALDLASGDELWRQTLDRTPSGGLDQEICPAGLEPPGDCWPRSSEPALLAVKNGTVYFADPVSGRITALSADDGAERWSVFIPDRVPEMTLVPWLVAFDDGIAVQLSDPEAGAEIHLGFWRADNGAEVWSVRSRLGGVASDGRSLFISVLSEEGTCCLITKIDAQTGEVIRSTTLERARVAAYLSDGSVVLETTEQGSNDTPPSVTSLIGLEPETLEETWRVTLPEGACGFPAFPVPDPEHIVCFGFGTTDLRIFEWSSPPASPVASQPEPTALPFEEGDTLMTTVDGVALRAAPDPAAETMEIIPEAGSHVLFIGEVATDSSGLIWYRVRSNETALTGYIPADQLALER